ncbi:MAG TPA: hypothetical protein VH914_08830 [Acidimicrobiia bacterium]|nr:hypothetical protein [Acidimicrobiia bacterium]
MTSDVAIAEHAPAGPREHARRPVDRRTVVALASWSALVAVAAGVGAVLLHLGVRMQIGAPPLTGRVGFRLDARVLPAIALGGLGVRALPVLAQQLRWRALLAVTVAATGLWTLAINLVDGRRMFTWPVHHEYSATAAHIVSPHAFLSTFPAHILRYNVHTQGHPPAMELILWCVDRLGWHGAGAAATLYIAAGVAAGAAALVALREVAGEARARAAAPFLAMFPAAIWMATSGDAFFAGVSAWAVALLVLATGRTGRRSDLLAFAGGLLLGVTAFLSYGLVLIAIVPTVVGSRRRRVRPLLVGALGAAVVFGAFAVAGFSWITGLRLTHARYEAGVASRRPYAYFLVADLAAFAIAVGPAAAAGLAVLRDRATWLLVGATLAVVALADLSGMSKGEVERIWLPFVPWVLLSTTALAATNAGDRAQARIRWLLGAQVATAIVLQVGIRSPW